MTNPALNPSVKKSIKPKPAAAFTLGHPGELALYELRHQINLLASLAEKSTEKFFVLDAESLIVSLQILRDKAAIAEAAFRKGGVQ